MLPKLLFPWSNVEWFGVHPFHVFTYVEFRTVFAAITSFFICLYIGPRLIRLLQSNRFSEHTGKTDSERLAHLHDHKAQTPTMGGIMIIGSVLLSTILWARIDEYYVIMAILSTLLLTLVGFHDDWIKLSSKNAPGLTSLEKVLPQVLVGLLLGYLLYSHNRAVPDAYTLYFPFKLGSVDLGLLYIPFVALVIGATSNAVNLTDGLDGLASGLSAMVALTFVGFCLAVGSVGPKGLANYLHLPPVAGADELAIFSASILGGCLGFLWFNCHPAKIFMGDTGALPLGGAIGFIAVATKHEIILMIAGGIFVVEALSVILQVGSYKTRHKRLFLCAPIHHHFQFKGWSETQVVIRFWIIGAILALFSIASLRIR